jgi:uncharacterized protein
MIPLHKEEGLMYSSLIKHPILAEKKLGYYNALYILYAVMTLDDAKIESIRDYFKTRPVLKAYLFGSYARAMADDQSDIDILVDLDYSQKIGLQFIQMKLDLEALLTSKVDLVSSNGMSKYIKPIVDLEKRLIYAK